MITQYATKEYFNILQEIYKAMIMLMMSSLMNPFYIEKRIKANNSNLIQHKNSKSYINIHGFFGRENKFSSN